MINERFIEQAHPHERHYLKQLENALNLIRADKKKLHAEYKRVAGRRQKLANTLKRRAYAAAEKKKASQ